MRTPPEVMPINLLMQSEPALMKKLALVGTVSLVFLAGCGVGSKLQNGRVTVFPSSATVQPGGVQLFAATVTPGANSAVTWSVSGMGCTGTDCGTIDASGKFTAPATVPNPATVTVSARSVVDAANLGTATVNINAGPGNAANFTAVGSMTAARASHTATLLPNGKVLIAGGSDGLQSLASAELYDPATKTFTPTGSMTTARMGHTATLLPNGKVLIAGGRDGMQPLPSAELYDLAAGTFAPTGSMITAGVGQAPLVARPAVLLATGKVLFAGDNAQLYDPGTGTFALAGPYVDTAVVWDTATLLLDGRVLLTGFAGAPGNPVGAAELFDPQSGTFSITDSRGYFGFSTATLLTNGTVLVVSANDDVLPDNEDVYDPASGTFTHIGQTIGAHGYSAAVPLADGTVLISGGEEVGGDGSSSAELSLPTTRTFVFAGNMTTGREMHTATLLPDGSVLIAGGISIWGSPPQMTSTAEIYTP